MHNPIGSKNCIIFFAMGGGGDIVSTFVLGEMLSRLLRVRIVYASIVWERFVYDPLPGPIPLNSLIGVERGTYIGYTYGACYALRRGRIIEPTPCIVSSTTKTPIALLDLWGGEISLRLGLEELSRLHGCDVVVGIDVGGDVLAEGCEEGLWSPLADSLGLAAIANSSLRAYLLIFAPGADGELGTEMTIKRVMDYIDAYVWSIGLHKEYTELLEEIVSRTTSEASRIPLLVLKGYKEVVQLRSGTRKIELSPLHIIGFILDAKRIYDRSKLARAVTDTETIIEAKNRLNEYGVYTELDLEQDLEYTIYSGSLSAIDLAKLRNEGRKKLNWFTKCGKSGIPETY